MYVYRGKMNDTGSQLHKENRENGPKIPCQGKHGEFGNFAKTQGFWFAQVVDSLIQKIRILLYLL